VTTRGISISETKGLPPRPGGEGLGWVGHHAGGPDPFARLVQLWREHEHLLARLRRCGAERSRARAYLARPGCNVLLARAALERARTKYSGVLLLLRANRLEVLRLLGGPEAPAAG
jgi:hypothetical protein